MTTVTLPRADLAAVEQDRAGRFVPSRDLYRWMRDITARVGGVTALNLVDVMAEAEAAKRLAGVALMYSSETGEDGLQGPKGETGIQGPAGADGAPGGGSVSVAMGQHFLLGDPLEPEPSFPGTQGATGPIGPAGADGNHGAVFILDVPEPEFAIPGQRGIDGVAGSTGAQGPAGPALYLLEDPPDPEAAWPGPAGATGATGAPGGGGGSVTAATLTSVPYDTQYAEVTVSDALLTGTSKVLIWPGNVLDSDENTPDMGSVDFNAVPSVGSMVVRLSCTDPLDRLGGVYKINYLIG